MAPLIHNLSKTINNFNFYYNKLFLCPYKNFVLQLFNPYDQAKLYNTMVEWKRKKVVVPWPIKITYLQTTVFIIIMLNTTL